MRIRLPELLEEHNTTVHYVAERSGGRIDKSALYRLAAKRGRVKLVSSELVEALCDVLGIPPHELHTVLELEGP